MIGGFHLGAAVLAGFVILITASGFGQAPAPGSGKDLFERRCGGCHALDRDKEGPRLGGVYGRRAGSVDTFDYSEALKAANITWNDESLEKWLSGPEQMVPNTDMAFHLERADERREIVAFLKSNSGK
jgi:cytochrome c